MMSCKLLPPAVGVNGTNRRRGRTTGSKFLNRLKACVYHHPVHHKPMTQRTALPVPPAQLLLLRPLCAPQRTSSPAPTDTTPYLIEHPRRAVIVACEVEAAQRVPAGTCGRWHASGSGMWPHDMRQSALHCTNSNNRSGLQLGMPTSQYGMQPFPYTHWRGQHPSNCPCYGGLVAPAMFQCLRSDALHSIILLPTVTPSAPTRTPPLA